MKGNSMFDGNTLDMVWPEKKPLPRRYRCDTDPSPHTGASTSGDPREMLPAIRAVVRQVDERLPLSSVQTPDERLDGALAPRRFNLWLVSLCSIRRPRP
jgi:hypothetical protein